jgi:hypothetical protein
MSMAFGGWRNKIVWLFTRTLPRIPFWVQGVVYYIYLLYCLVGYRDIRELCFYCKYGIAVGGFNVLLGILWVKGGLPYGYLCFVALLFCLVIVFRQAKKDLIREQKEAESRKKSTKQNQVVIEE